MVVSRERASSRRGFTLIELIVVLAILGIAAAFILPPFGSGLSHWRLQGTVREVATLLKFARTQAVASMRPLQVVLDRPRRLFWLDNAHAPSLVDPAQAEHRKLRLYALPEGVRFGDIATDNFDAEVQQFRIVFFPRGSSSGGKIELLDKRGRGYWVSVDSATGRAGVTRGDG